MFYKEGSHCTILNKIYNWVMLLTRMYFRRLYFIIVTILTTIIQIIIYDHKIINVNISYLIYIKPLLTEPQFRLFLFQSTVICKYLHNREQTSFSYIIENKPVSLTYIFLISTYLTSSLGHKVMVKT